MWNSGQSLPPVYLRLTNCMHQQVNNSCVTSLTGIAYLNWATPTIHLFRNLSARPRIFAMASFTYVA